MDVFAEIDALETAHLKRGPTDQPSLWKSYERLLERWQGGERDRETTLRLLFLAWYSWAEPHFLTGLPEAPLTLVHDLFVALDVNKTQDPEVCFVLRVMIGVIGDFMGQWNAELGELIERNRVRLNNQLPVDPAIFEGRGAYGHYFAHQARGHLRYLAESHTFH